MASGTPANLISLGAVDFGIVVDSTVIVMENVFRHLSAPGVRLSPSAVKSYAGTPLYDPSTLRTVFLQFDDSNWEDELMAFKNTDVEVMKALADAKADARIASADGTTPLTYGRS